ncbi:MAG: BMC domain-containing protein [Planctomycetes bacterium]|nr:BMC domain-containing protein [Planctomycetota bacterium]
MASGIELRAYTFLDCMQPAVAAYIGTTARGFLPVQGQASLFVEVAPGIAINRLTDIALKNHDVRPGLQVVERAFGLLEIHSDSQSEVRAAGARMLESLELKEDDRLKPRVMSSQIITNIDPDQAQLINRIRFGDMILGGETLYILEVHPAAYVTIAANEAEKAAPIKLIEMQSSGAFGRLYLGGTESAIREAVQAVTQALENISGRENR